MAGVDPDPKLRSRPIALTSLIAAQLEKLLCSSVFKGARGLQELLRFTVQETLAGRGSELKEYVLAVAVLGKGDSFDPKADPIVRAQMRRVRERLRRYYATEGRHDPVVIDIPKGSYMPTFRRATRDDPVALPMGKGGIIVGREKELIDLRSAFASAAAGTGRLVCVSGEPGIGKTTVVESFLRQLSTSAADHYVARGRCSERLAGTEAYLPVMEAFDTLLGSDESVCSLMSGAAPSWYAQVAPLTDDSAGVGTRAAGPVSSQQRLKREFVAFLHELAIRQPVVLFLDDLHWADASTIDVLAYAATRCASQRILIVASYRPADLFATDHPFLRVKLELEGRGICRDIALPFLRRADVDHYLALGFPDHLFPPELSTRIHDRTEGNPLFVEDLAQFLRERGVLAEHRGRWVMVGQLREVEKELPDSVRSMIEKKIGQLGDDDRRLLVAASVQGHEFDSAVLSSVLGMDAADVEERLDALERIHGFVRLVDEKAFPDRTFTTVYRFVHVLYQNALCGSLRPTRRASLSIAVAEGLLRRHGTQRPTIASELAMLFEAARDFDRAAEYFLLAAEQAAHMCANREVVVLARRGLEALMRLPETPARVRRELRLQTILGPALMNTAGYGTPDVEAVYVRARELCQRIDETAQVFPVIWGHFQYRLSRAEYRTARELADQLLGSAQKLQDPALVMMARGALANTCWLTGDFEAVRTHAEQAMAIYVPKQHHSLASFHSGRDFGVAQRSGSAVSLWLLGYPDQAVQRCEEGITLARELAHTTSLVFALIFSAIVHQHRREPQPTRQQVDAAIALATEQELAQWLPWGTALRGWALVAQDESEAGISQLRQAIAGWRAVRGGALTPYFLGLLADAYATTGQAEAALTTLAEALAITEQTREGYMEAELYRLKGELQPQPQEAEACFHQALGIARRQHAKSFELRTAMSLYRLYCKQGRHTEARQMLSEVYGWFTEGFETADLKDAGALLESLRFPNGSQNHAPVTVSTR